MQGSSASPSVSVKIDILLRLKTEEDVKYSLLVCHLHERILDGTLIDIK